MWTITWSSAGKPKMTVSEPFPTKKITGLEDIAKGVNDVSKTET